MKITLLLVFALGLTALLRHQSAALRHWLLACTVVCAAAIPALAGIIPTWQLWSSGAATPVMAGVARPLRMVSRTPGPVAPTSTSTPAFAAVEADHQSTSLTGWIAGIWMAGAAFGLAVITAGFVRLTRLARSSAVIDAGQWRDTADRIRAERRLPRRVVLLASNHPSLLVTWGTLRPKVILPAGALSWPPERIQVVLSHELAHVQRADWAVQVLGELLKAVYWFNPLIWVVGRRLRLESERACDDVVMNDGLAAPHYASQLVELARALNQQPRTWLPAPAIARPSSLQRRVSAMLNASLNRRPLPRSLRAVVAAALLATTGVIAAAQAPFATVSGSVIDPQGGLVAAATLKLTHTATEVKHEVKSDQTGRFEFTGLSAGDYVLEATIAGFAIARDHFTLSPGQVSPRTVVLELGTLQETITVIDSDVPPANGMRRSASLTPKPCTASASGGQIRPPLKVVDVRPRYPLNLRQSRASGRVEMEATIGPDGTVTRVTVISSPEPDMSDAAVEAVRQWRFTSTLLNCVPVNVTMHVLVTFQPYGS